MSLFLWSVLTQIHLRNVGVAINLHLANVSWASWPFWLRRNVSIPVIWMKSLKSLRVSKLGLWRISTISCSNMLKTTFERDTGALTLATLLRRKCGSGSASASSGSINGCNFWLCTFVASMHDRLAVELFHHSHAWFWMLWLFANRSWLFLDGRTCLDESV